MKKPAITSQDPTTFDAELLAQVTGGCGAPPLWHPGGPSPWRPWAPMPWWPQARWPQPRSPKPPCRR